MRTTTNTSIRIDPDIRYYAKMAARKTGLTFGEYYTELILKDLRDNHLKLFKEYIECTDIDKKDKTERWNNSISKAILDGKEIKDSAGNVILPAKEEIKDTPIEEF